MKTHLILLLVLSTLSGNFFAQGLIDGFFKGKGNTDLALSASYQHSDEFFAGKNLIKYERNITAIGAFVAHGLTDKIDLISNIPLINGQLQDMAVMAKFRLLNKQIKNTEFTLFSGLGMSFPLMKYRTETGQAIGQRATQILPKLGFQFKFGNGIFIQAQSGYNYNFSPVQSSIPASVKFGLARAKWYFDAWFDMQEGEGNKDYQGDVAFASFRELVTSYQHVGGTIYRGIGTRLGVFINGFYTLNGRNTGKVWAAGTGIVIKFKAKEK